ncbi:MAG: SdpI family protein [Eubacteriales bacterium]|nr:SdpI family protein [Eubacteriales bacterium]
MGFWIYMLVMNLLIPVTMIGFGKYFIKKAPKEINGVFGYRTPMSMKNRETWEFAHQYIGRIWCVGGMILLPFTVIAMLPAVGKSVDCIGHTGGAVLLVQMILIVGSIFPTEMALRRKFDKTGKRR